MTRMVASLVLLVSAFSAPVLAEESESGSNWGVGLQGNMPLWGGLSVKYRGLGRVHLQLIEHYVQHGEGNFSLMIGVQTPIIVARGKGMNIFIAPAVGFQRRRSVRDEGITGYDEDRQGGALFIGTELYLDELFGLETRSRYGLTFQFGQAIGRVTHHDRTFDVSTEDADGNPAETSASVAVGVAFHIYF